MGATTHNASSSEWFAPQEGDFVPWWGKLALPTIKKLGPVPRHVAFILDGNRRYAKSRHMNSVVDGHSAGFERLAGVLDWCNMIDIHEVTLYAFSIENFKRSQDEVDGLFNMAKGKFERLLAEEEILEAKQVCFRFFGQIHMLPVDLQKLIAQIEDKTKTYKAGFINICLAYTSRAEVTTAMNDIRLGVAEGLLQDEDISDELIDACLDTRNSFPVDMVIRTSGEHRLSDFLLWQSSNIYIHFEDVLWPEFKFHHFLKAIYAYQNNFNGIAQIESVLIDTESRESTNNQRQAEFLQWMEERRTKQRQEILESI